MTHFDYINNKIPTYVETIQSALHLRISLSTDISRFDCTIDAHIYHVRQPSIAHMTVKALGISVTGVMRSESLTSNQLKR